MADLQLLSLGVIGLWQSPGQESEGPWIPRDERKNYVLVLFSRRGFKAFIEDVKVWVCDPKKLMNRSAKLRPTVDFHWAGILDPAGLGPVLGIGRGTNETCRPGHKRLNVITRRG